MNPTHFHGNKEPDTNSSYCHFHHNEVFVGICPLCLNERLQTLASLRQSHYNKHKAQQHSSSRGHSFSLTTKILSLSSLLHRLDLRSHKNSSYDRDCNSSSSSQEDSFISIKFEENGAAFWDKEKQSDKNRTTDDINTSVVEHIRTRQWRKRIGHIFDNIKWRTGSKYGKKESRS
ncbi:unnamed protein product [Rhodiola kirilowii]